MGHCKSLPTVSFASILAKKLVSLHPALQHPPLSQQLKELFKTCQSNPLFKNFRVFPSTQRDWSCPGSLCKIYLLLVSLFPWLFQPGHCNSPFLCFLFAPHPSPALILLASLLFLRYSKSNLRVLQACCIYCSLRSFIWLVPAPPKVSTQTSPIRGTSLDHLNKRAVSTSITFNPLIPVYFSF